MSHTPCSLTFALLLAVSSLAQGDGTRLMTWNIEGGKASPEEIATRVKNALAEVGPVEVLVLQEIVAEAQVQAAAEAGGFAHWAMSDFSPPVEISGVWWKSLEVAMLSRQPISAAGEWDISGRKPQAHGDRRRGLQHPGTGAGGAGRHRSRGGLRAERWAL